MMWCKNPEKLEEFGFKKVSTGNGKFATNNGKPILEYVLKEWLDGEVQATILYNPLYSTIEDEIQVVVTSDSKQIFDETVAMEPLLQLVKDGIVEWAV